jgi:hypothetical protein
MTILINDNPFSFFEILAGTSENSDDTYDHLVGETFYVTGNKGNETLYYAEPEETQNSYALNLSTKEVSSSSDFPIFAEGKPFEFNGGVSIYQNGSPNMTILIPEVDYSSLGLDNADYYYTIKDIELCDNWVYYKLEANEYAPEASIGWRDGYRRIKTQVLREAVGGGNKEILFEY